MKKPTSFRLSDEALSLLEKLASEMGLSQASVLETLIRDRAKKEGVKKK